MKLALVALAALLSSLAGATIVWQLPGSARVAIAGFIKQGKDPLLIRVATITDPLLIAAIEKGAHGRSIKILCDKPSAGLDALAAERLFNLDIRVSRTDRRGTFRQEKLTNGFVMSLEEGTFGHIGTPTVWARGNFRSPAWMAYESGGVIWEESPRTAKAFQWEFDMALPIEWSKQHGPEAAPIPTVVPRRWEWARRASY